MNLLLSDPAFLAASSSVSGPSDPYFANVSLLLHGDGANGSTTITDSSPTPKTVTAVGNAQISTAQSKFGGSSIAFDGNGDAIIFASNESTEFGLQNFTIETWIYVVSYSGFQAIFDTTGNGGVGLWSGCIVSCETGTIKLYLRDSTPATLASLTTVPLSTWTHVAAVRNGSTLLLYLNGQLSNSTVTAVAAGSNGAARGIGGAANGNYSFNGYIDDFRITKGVARYTSNFTPPTAPFPDA